MDWPLRTGLGTILISTQRKGAGMIRTATQKPVFFTSMMLSLVATACSSEGGVRAQEGACLIYDSREIGLLDSTPSGQTVGETLSLVMKEHHTQLVYDHEGTSTDVGIQVSQREGSFVFVRRSPDPSWPLPQPCADEVRIPAHLVFQTGDGAFDERFDATIRVRAEGILVDETLHESELKGTYDPSWAELRPHEEITYYLDVRFEPEGVVGSVTGIAMEPYEGAVVVRGVGVGVLSPSGP